MVGRQPDGWRLKFHLMPPEGWLNDPNGLCQFRGQYHIFFQYQPEDPRGPGKTPRLWGHYAGPGLTKLRFEGIPFEQNELDRNGSYSGSALVEDGKLQLFYTGNIRLPGEYDYIHDGRESNTIRIVSNDGLHFGTKELLLRTADYPSDCTRHVRDPKVWKENGNYYMVLGARLKEEKGAVLLYRSSDLKRWEFLKCIATGEAFGYMWECPDYFRVGKYALLSVCPQGLGPEEYRYQNVYQSGYFTVTGILENAPQLGEFREWDYGFDFYAPQTFADDRGRRLLIGWAGMPDAPYENPTAERGWQHALTIPREIVEENGKVLQKPVRELENLRYGATALTGENSFVLEDGSGEVMLRKSGEDEYPWQIMIGEGLRISGGDGTVCLELSEQWGRGRRVRRARVGKCRKIRLLIDTSMAELYLNGGETVFTARFYPDYRENRQLEVKLRCPGMEGFGWQMKNMDTGMKTR